MPATLSLDESITFIRYCGNYCGVNGKGSQALSPDEAREAVAAFVAKGGDINFQCPSTGDTPLIRAAFGKCHTLYEALLAAGADPFIRNQYKLTAEQVRASRAD